MEVRSPFNTAERGSDPDRITLVNGRTFVVAESDGSISRATDGTVFEDLRMLSRLRFDVADVAGRIERETLGTSSSTPFQCTFASRPDPAIAHRAEFYVHRQWVGRGVRHDFEIHNTGAEAVDRTVSVSFDADFAHLFEMKAGRSGFGTSAFDWSDDVGRLGAADDVGLEIEIRTDPAPAEVDTAAKTISWNLTCTRNEPALVTVTFDPCWDDEGTSGLAFPIGLPAAAAGPATSLEAWHRTAPRVVSDDARLSIAASTSVTDLASLRLVDPDHTDRVVLAAGAPWFMTLFGRDSLLTSWMLIPFMPELAIGTLDALAGFQGTDEVAATEEQPGKIIHELRHHGGDAAFERHGRYYGTVDATPLFVMVAGEAHRWGHLLGTGLTDRWPAIRAALEWVRRRMAGDPRGLLRYRRSTPIGLVNQGWKDSWDGVSCADGRLPDGEIALCEVQGYAYAALRAGAYLARHVDRQGADPGVDADQLERDAEHLAVRFDDLFWNESASAYALGLDGNDAMIDAVTTNPGHAIWCGITDRDRAGRYLDRVVGDDLFSGWGLRTLSPSCARYDPLSYHNGSVWPHDTAIVAAGAAVAGRRDAVDRLFDAALDAASFYSGRPPELFAGIDRSVVDAPVAYPNSCSPQAWASASTWLHLRAALRLEVEADRPTVDRRSTVPVAISGVRVGDVRFGVARGDGGLTVSREHQAGT